MNSKGVTLIELVVVLSIFILIFGAATTVLLSIIQHERAILKQGQALNELSYMEEFMSNDLRMAKFSETPEEIDCMDQNIGYAYLLTRYDSKEKVFKGIKFINQAEDSICEEFFIDTTDPQKPILKVLKNNEQDSQAIQLSSAKLNIESLRFALNGLDGGEEQLDDCLGNSLACGARKSDNLEPRVTLLFTFTFSSDLERPRFIQTTVSKMFDR